MPGRLTSLLLAAVAVTNAQIIDVPIGCECLGDNSSIPRKYGNYVGSEYGKSCDEPWDDAYKYCRGKRRNKKDRSCWCGQRFCYVDPTTCYYRVSSRLFPEVHDLYYSYASCEGVAEAEKIEACLDKDFASEPELIEKDMVFSADNDQSDAMTSFEFWYFKMSWLEPWVHEEWPDWDYCYVASCSSWGSGGDDRTRREEDQSRCRLKYHEVAWVDESGSQLSDDVPIGVEVDPHTVAQVRCYMVEEPSKAIMRPM